MQKYKDFYHENKNELTQASLLNSSLRTNKMLRSIDRTNKENSMLKSRGSKFWDFDGQHGDFLSWDDDDKDSQKLVSYNQ